VEEIAKFSTIWDSRIAKEEMVPRASSEICELIVVTGVEKLVAMPCVTHYVGCVPMPFPLCIHLSPPSFIAPFAWGTLFEPIPPSLYLNSGML